MSLLYAETFLHSLKRNQVQPSYLLQLIFASMIIAPLFSNEFNF